MPDLQVEAQADASARRCFGSLLSLGPTLRKTEPEGPKMVALVFSGSWFDQNDTLVPQNVVRRELLAAMLAR